MRTFWPGWRAVRGGVVQPPGVRMLFLIRPSVSFFGAPVMMRLFLVAAAATFVGQATASAQTAAVRRAREAVALINSATPKLLKAYVDSAFGGPMRNTPTDAYVRIFLSLRERSGGLEWVSVQEDSANRAVVRLTRKLTGETNALQVSVEEASPHRVTRLDLRPPPGAATRVASDAELASALQQYVTALASADAFWAPCYSRRMARCCIRRRSGARTRTSVRRIRSIRSSTSVR